MNNLVGIGIFRRRRTSSIDQIESQAIGNSSSTSSNKTTINPNSSLMSDSPVPGRWPRESLKPYEVPPENGECLFLRLPGEVLANVFRRLDRPELMRCFRLCKTINEFLSGSAEINLHLTLMSNSLHLNPHVLTAPLSNPLLMPRTSAELLSTLRERLTRFRNLTPKGRPTSLQFSEPEGRLYEYLEGVLLRGVGDRFNLPHQLACYDLRKLGEWEDTGENVGEDEMLDAIDHEEGMGGSGEGEEREEGEEEEQLVRRLHRFDFPISDFAVDPGQDLLVVVQVSTTARRTHKMQFHLLSLSTFKPHPRAQTPILDWPIPLQRNRVMLGFQICDDGFYVLHNNNHGGTYDQLYGWQWTTGRLHVTLRAIPIMTFESFVLLTPTSFIIPTITTRIDPHSLVLEELDNPNDLTWDHHINLYAFPPFPSSSAPSETAPSMETGTTINSSNLTSSPSNSTTPLTSTPPTPVPPALATHVATIDLPHFLVDLDRQIPPPRVSIRTDPPPRNQFPTHPSHNPAPFQPDPETGLIVMEVLCQMPNQRDPHFVILMLKQTLMKYLPPPNSPLLRQSFPRPVPVIPWSTIAPHVRMFGPDIDPSSWVCYVYHHYWVHINSVGEDGRATLRLYDFDPLRVRKEILDRKYKPNSPSRTFRNIAQNEEISSYRDGIQVVQGEEVIEAAAPLEREIRTGKSLPYMVVAKPTSADVALIDGERIVLVSSMNPVIPSFGSRYGRLDIMEF